jgi:hypothetical protein
VVIPLRPLGPFGGSIAQGFGGRKFEMPVFAGQSLVISEVLSLFYFSLSLKGPKGLKGPNADGTRVSRRTLYDPYDPLPRRRKRIAQLMALWGLVAHGLKGGVR